MNTGNRRQCEMGLSESKGKEEVNVRLRIERTVMQKVWEREKGEKKWGKKNMMKEFRKRKQKWIRFRRLRKWFTKKWKMERKCHSRKNYRMNENVNWEMCIFTLGLKMGASFLKCEVRRGGCPVIAGSEGAKSWWSLGKVDPHYWDENMKGCLI